MPPFVLYCNGVNVQLTTYVFIVQLFWPQGATHMESRRPMRSLMPDGSPILTSQTLMHGSWEKVNLLMTESILSSSYCMLFHREAASDLFEMSELRFCNQTVHNYLSWVHKELSTYLSWHWHWSLLVVLDGTVWQNTAPSFLWIGSLCCHSNCTNTDVSNTRKCIVVQIRRVEIWSSL